MVDADIVQAQQQISQQETVARQIVSQKVPVRRFGGAVTRAEQQRVIQQRQQARTSLKQLTTQRKEIQQVQKQREQAVALRREQERLIRIAKVERKISLKRFADIIPELEERLKQSLPAETRAIILEQIRRGEDVKIPSILETRQTLIPPPVIVQTVARAEDLPGPVTGLESILPVFTGISKRPEVPLPAGVETVRKGIGFVQGKLEEASAEIRRDIIPGVREQELEANIIKADTEQLSQRIKIFNAKFGDRELSESEFRQADVERQRIQREQTRLTQRQEKLQTKIEAPTRPSILPARAVAGFIGAIPAGASLGLGLLATPKETVTTTVVDLPQEFIRDPFGTGAELAGTGVFFGALGRISPRKIPTRAERIGILEGLAETEGGVLGRPPPIKIRRPKIAELPEARRLALLRMTIKSERTTRMESASRGRIAALDFAREIERLEPRAIALRRAREANQRQRQAERLLEKQFAEQASLRPKPVVESVRDIALRRMRTATRKKEEAAESLRRVKVAGQARVTAVELSRELGRLEPRRLALFRMKKQTESQKRLERGKELSRARLVLSELETNIASLKPIRATALARKRAKEFKVKKEAERIRRATEDKFLTDARGGTVLLLEPLKPRVEPKPKPIVKIVAPAITDLQIASLKRLKKRQIPKERIVRTVRPDVIVALEPPRAKPVRRTGIRAVLLERELFDRLRTKKKTAQVEQQLIQESALRPKRQQALFEFEKARTKQRQRSVVVAKSREKQAEAQGFAGAQAFAQAEAQAFRQSFNTSQAQQFSLATAQAVNQATKLKQPAPIKARPLLQEVPFTPALLRVRRRKKAKGKVKKEQGFNAFARPEGKKKFVRLNQVPLTKQRAKDVMGFFVDNTLSARGKISTTTGKPKKARLDIPKNFFINRQKKFREFKIRKGKKIATPNMFIEKKGRPRIDTFGEKNRLTVLSLLSTKRKKTKRRTKGKK